MLKSAGINANNNKNFDHTYNNRSNNYGELGTGVLTLIRADIQLG
jgi:hypothetical protein